MPESSVPGKTALTILLSLTFMMIVACSEKENGTVISSTELISRLSDNTAPVILDVRTVREYQRGHIPGAVNISLDKIHGYQAVLAGLTLDTADEIVVYGEDGGSAERVANYLREQGFFEVRQLQGDMKNWRRDKLPMQHLQVNKGNIYRRD